MARGFESFVHVAGGGVVAIEHQLSPGADGKRIRHDQRDSGVIGLIDSESFICDVRGVVVRVGGDVQRVNHPERRGRGRFDVGADHHDLFRHVAVVIRFHRANVHGASTTQVHGLHELRIVLPRQRGVGNRDGRAVAIACDGHGDSINATATETGVIRRGLSGLRGDGHLFRTRRPGRRGDCRRGFCREVCGRGARLAGIPPATRVLAYFLRSRHRIRHDHIHVILVTGTRAAAHGKRECQYRDSRHRLGYQRLHYEALHSIAVRGLALEAPVVRSRWRDLFRYDMAPNTRPELQGAQR